MKKPQAIPLAEVDGSYVTEDDVLGWHASIGAAFLCFLLIVGIGFLEMVLS